MGDIWLRVSTAEYAFVCEHTDLTPQEFWSSRLPQMLMDTRAADGYVCEADGQIAGFVTLDPANEYMYELFVDSPFQGKGLVGPVLINLAKNLRPHIWTHVYLQKVRAVRFYERHGFFFCDTHDEPETKQVKLKMEWLADKSPNSR